MDRPVSHTMAKHLLEANPREAIVKATKSPWVDGPAAVRNLIETAVWKANQGGITLAYDHDVWDRSIPEEFKPYVDIAVHKVLDTVFSIAKHYGFCPEVWANQTADTTTLRQIEKKWDEALARLQNLSPWEKGTTVREVIVQEVMVGVFETAHLTMEGAEKQALLEAQAQDRFTNKVETILHGKAGIKRLRGLLQEALVKLDCFALICTTFPDVIAWFDAHRAGGGKTSPTNLVHRIRKELACDTQADQEYDAQASQMDKDYAEIERLRGLLQEQIRRLTIRKKVSST